MHAVPVLIAWCYRVSFEVGRGLLAGIPIMDSAKRVLLKRKELQLLADWLREGKGRPYHAV